MLSLFQLVFSGILAGRGEPNIRIWLWLFCGKEIVNVGTLAWIQHCGCSWFLNHGIQHGSGRFVLPLVDLIAHLAAIRVGQLPLVQYLLVFQLWFICDWSGIKFRRFTLILTKSAKVIYFFITGIHSKEVVSGALDMESRVYIFISLLLLDFHILI